MIKTIKWILVYLHRYVGLWCMLMGYYTLLGLIIFPAFLEWGMMVTVGYILTLLVLGISFKGDENTKGIFRSFGVWW
ncbi:MAG: hypothetical protein KKD44_28800 [Proteobacteria bacterium]|nr:hypothetical protein [Pseudomonadota bacterium]